MEPLKPFLSSPFTNIVHVSTIVKDKERTTDYYASLGIGPFSKPHQLLKYHEVGGQQVDLNLKEVLTRMGSLDFEVIPLPEVPSLYHEFVKRRGEGPHHIGFLIEDADQVEKELTGRGIKVIQKGKSDNGGYLYAGTDSVGGIVFELIQRPPGAPEIAATKPENTPFAEIMTVAAVVKDIDRAIQHYQSLGIGPFKPVPMQVTEKWFKGKPAEFKSKAMIAKIGKVGLELIQPVVGPSSFLEMLEKKGEGIHHLGFYAEDLDAEEEKLVKKGVKVRQKARGKDCGFTHFETDQVGGVTFELLKMPPLE